MKTEQPDYITPATAQQMTAELNHLLYHLRPPAAMTVAWAAAVNEANDADLQQAKAHLHDINRRAGYLKKRLDEATVVDPAQSGEKADGTVQFGATVEFFVDGKDRYLCTVLGVEDHHPSQGIVSYTSATGQMLLGKGKGERFEALFAGQPATIEIVRVGYPKGQVEG